MKKLIDNLHVLESRINGKDVFLFLDLDGTIVPIRKNPSSVKLSDSMKSILEKALKVKGITIAIISGRDINGLKKIVKIKGMIYSGNHGMEVGNEEKIKVLIKNKYFIKDLKKICGTLRKELKPYKGIIIEDKTLTLSVHFRMVDNKQVKQIKKIFDKVLSSYLFKKNIAVFSGKKVWEIRPVSIYNKGKIVKILLASKGKIVPIYFGDDHTDEDAFKALKRKGISVKVGNKTSKSCADFYVENLADVRKTLKLIINNRERRIKNS